MTQVTNHIKMKVMKTTGKLQCVFTIGLMFLIPQSSYSQRRYHPFVKEGKVWNYQTGKETEISYIIKGDTLIGTNTYGKLYSIREGVQSYEMALRDEGYKVLCVEAGAERETTLYDFDLDSMEVFYDEPVETLAGIGCKRYVTEECFVCGHPCRIITYNPYGISESGERWYTTSLNFWLEGIGGTEGIASDATLLSVYEDDECIYDRKKGELRDYATHAVVEEIPEGYIPFVATGKKWVQLNMNNNPSYYSFITYTAKEAVLKEDGYVWFNLYRESVNQDGKVTNSDDPAYTVREWDGCVYRYIDSPENNSLKLFDLRVSVGDSIPLYGTEIGYYTTPTQLDSICVQGERWINNCGHNYRVLTVESEKEEYEGNVLIEGIGNYNYFLDSKFYPDGWSGNHYEQIMEVYLGDELIFRDIPDFIKDIYLGVSVPQDERMMSNTLFDLQGRRLREAPKRGVYIRNGELIMDSGLFRKTF